MCMCIISYKMLWNNNETPEEESDLVFIFKMFVFVFFCFFTKKLYSTAHKSYYNSLCFLNEYIASLHFKLVKSKCFCPDKLWLIHHILLWSFHYCCMNVPFILTYSGITHTHTHIQTDRQICSSIQSKPHFLIMSDYFVSL